MRSRRAGLHATLVLGLTGCTGGDGGPGPNPTYSMVLVGGEGQVGITMEPLPEPYEVRVTLDGEPAAGVTVTWVITQGSGTIAPTAPATDAAGIARAVHTLGTGENNYSVKAFVTSQESAAVTITSAGNDPFPIPLVATLPVPAAYGIHDTFVRDGLAFASLWNTGIRIIDVGNGIRGGTPGSPVTVSTLVTSIGPVSTPSVHNAWWFHNPVTTEKRYLFVGQEGPGVIGASSSGDIKVVDVSDLAAPVEVGFFHPAGAGTHNFWMDEPGQTLYAAYYNGGVVSLDVSGVLNGDLSGRLRAQATPGGPGSTYVWGVMRSAGRVYAIDMLTGFWQLSPTTLQPVAGGNNVADRYSSDLWVSGDYAYTGTWGCCRNGTGRGDAIKVWRLGSSGAPTLIGSVLVGDVGTVSDLEVSDRGNLLVVSTENGSLAGLRLYRLTDPATPVIFARVLVGSGLHTVTLGRIGGKLYAFAAKNPGNPALLIYDLSAYDD